MLSGKKYGSGGHFEFTGYPSQKSRTAFVIDQILASISSGAIRVGERLPSERLLAEQMKVARGAVREALSALSVMGVVERRVGDGTYVTGEPRDETSVEQATNAIRQTERFSRIWEARRILEGVLIEIAVETADNSAINRVQASYERLSESVHTAEYEEYALADYDFHVSVAEATRNPFLVSALMPLLDVTHQQLSRRLNDNYVRTHGRHLMKEHRAILRALELRSKRWATRIVDLHFYATQPLFARASQSSSASSFLPRSNNV